MRSAGGAEGRGHTCHDELQQAGVASAACSLTSRLLRGVHCDNTKGHIDSHLLFPAASAARLLVSELTVRSHNRVQISYFSNGKKNTTLICIFYGWTLI